MLKSLWETTMELESYFKAVTDKFRANPTDQINSLIANAKIDGEYLNHRQLMGYYIIAATAGHDTTSNTAAGAMWAMAERPELLGQMQANPDLINAFIEESIRWEVPVKHFMRSAVADCEIDGRQIRHGDWLMLSYQSANRDETVWSDPFDFRIDRGSNPQIAFGYGVHVRLGQHLARMEMRILWEELFKRIKSVEMNGQGERTISNSCAGPSTCRSVSPPIEERESMQPWRKYRCLNCGLIFDEELGLPEEGIAPGTRFEDSARRLVLPRLRQRKAGFRTGRLLIAAPPTRIEAFVAVPVPLPFIVTLNLFQGQFRSTSSYNRKDQTARFAYP